MAKLTLKKALTDVTVYLFVQDSSKTTGEGLSGLVYNTANLVASYVRPLGSRTAITLDTLAAVTSAHTDGGFKEIDATNMPGVYRLDLPDAVCATGVPSAVVMLKGASNMTPVLLEIQLTDFDLNSTSNTVGTVTNLTNLPSIPNNWLTAAGIAADAGAEIADAVWDEAISGHTTAGSFGAKNQKVVPSETIGDYKADVSSLATSEALTTVGSNVTSIKTKTDNLPASPAAVGSAMTLATNAITAAVIATDAIDADAIKTDAVSEIQSGLATASALATVAGYVDDLEGRLTATRAGYLDKLNVSGTLAHSDDAATYKADVSGIPAAVWGHATRTLSSFGTLVSDIWSAATRTLSAFAFTVTGAKDASVDAIKAKTDTIPASPAAVGSAMTLTVGERTAIANEVEAQIIDDTDAEKVLKAITDKIASVNPSLDDLTLAGIASAVRTELATELARIDAAISTRLATAGYTAPANADISTIKSKTNNLPASPAASGEYTSALSAIQADLDNPNQYKADVSSLATSAALATVAGYIDTEVAAIKAKTDNLPASPAAVGSAMTLTSGERTAIANEVEAQIINETDSEKVLKAITDKIAEVNPSLDDLTLTSIASAVRTELAIELGRIDAAISSRLATAGYTAPANANINSIKAKTDNLPASPAASGEYTSALSTIQSNLDNPNQYKADISGLATSEHLREIENKIDSMPANITSEDVMESIVEGAITLRDSIKLMNAMNAGKVVGGNTSVIYFRNLEDTLDRIIMTVDSNGNRSNVSRNLS